METGKIIQLLAMVLLVSGCSSYSSNFACGDSKGATCMPMDKIDRMISSGEIELYTAQKCKGRGCKARDKAATIDKLKTTSLTEDEIYFKEGK